MCAAPFMYLDPANKYFAVWILIISAYPNAGSNAILMKQQSGSCPRSPRKPTKRPSPAAVSLRLFTAKNRRRFRLSTCRYDLPDPNRTSIAIDACQPCISTAVYSCPPSKSLSVDVCQLCSSVIDAVSPAFQQQSIAVLLQSHYQSTFVSSAHQ